MGTTTTELGLTPGARVLIAGETTCMARLSDFLASAGHEPMAAQDGEEVLRRVRNDDPELALLGIGLGRLNGYQVCERLKAHPHTRTIPVVLVLDAPDDEARQRGVAVGVEDFLTRGCDPLELLARVKSLVQVKRLNEQLEHAESVVYDLARTLERRDTGEGGEAETLADYACLLGRAAGLGAEELSVLRQGAMLHDIGKIAIRESILLKSERLTPEEYNEVKLHPVIGEQLCAPLRCAEDVLPVIRHHQERWDGQGYPDGLKGAETPLLARILAIADGFSAMTTDRPYRPAFSRAKAAEVLRDGAGTQWDPELIALFLREVGL
jgi:putative two-component system response regulator